MTDKELIEAAKYAAQELFILNNPLTECEQSAYNYLRRLCKRLSYFDTLAQYPPAVRTVLSLIEYLELNGRLNKGFDYIAVDNDGYIYEYDSAPTFQEKMWIPSNEENYIKASIGENNIGNTLLFHRTESGWEWLGNDEN